VFVESPGYLTGRAGKGTEQNGKLAMNFLKVVDVPLNVEYDEGRCLSAGRSAGCLASLRPAFSSSLSCRVEKRVWDNLKFYST